MISQPDPIPQLQVEGGQRGGGADRDVDDRLRSPVPELLAEPGRRDLVLRGLADRDFIARRTAMLALGFAAAFLSASG